MGRKTPRRKPQIGIWWDDGRTIVTLAHSSDERASGSQLRDSNLQHVTEWPHLAKKFGKSSKDGYECVPRGRVVFDTEREQGMIYHGSATSADRLELIAKKFQLTNWRAMRDAHYAFGDEIDQLFQDDE